MATVAQNGMALYLAEEGLQDDREIVMKVVSMQGKAFAYASSRLKCDREIVMTAIASFPEVLTVTSRELAWGRTKKKKTPLLSVGKNFDSEKPLLPKKGMQRTFQSLRPWVKLGAPLNRLNAILSLFQPLDRYRTPSATGTAIGRPLSRPILHPNTSGSPQLHRSEPLGGLIVGP